MSEPNPILATIIFIFAMQAMVLSGLLVRKKPRRQSNLFLALLVFFFALMAFNIALVNVLHSINRFDIFRYVQLELLYGIGPALYFYTRSITDANFKFTRKHAVHFIPVVLEFIFYRTALYRLGADGMYQSSSHPYTKVYLAEQWIGSLSITIYSILALLILIRYQRWLKQNYSNLEKRSANWLKVPVVFYAGFWLCWNVLTEIDRSLFDGTLKDTYFLPTFVGLAIVTYWIGFRGYVKAGATTSGYINKTSTTVEPPDPELAMRITTLMENQRPYLDPDLDLTGLSELLGMNPKQVSSVINRSLSKNFYDFVNHYRVEAFKKRVAAPGSEKLTLLGHAFESGFKSKSTFNEVFKKMTGKTPSEYVKSLKKESERKQPVV